MVTEKALYYSEKTGTPKLDCAPVDGDLRGPHAAAISAIADDDPDFVAWLTNKSAIERVAFINRLIEAGNRFIKYKGKPDDPLTEITMDAAGNEITLRADKGKPKSAAIRNWGLAVGNSVLIRCEMIRQGAPMDEAMLDLSQEYGAAPACSPMPHTITEALQEI